MTTTRKLIDCPPDDIEAVLAAAEASWKPPAFDVDALATEAGRLKHAHALGLYSAIAELRLAYHGALRSNTQSSPTTKP